MSSLSIPYRFLNALIIQKIISKSTHHPTNKKPHECGGRLDNQVGDIPKYVLLLSEITLLNL